MRLIISGGGTGGHIYPASSIYDKLDKSMPDCEKMYIGSKFGIEHKLFKDKSINFKEISARGFEKGDFLYSFVSFFYFIFSLFQSLSIMIRFKPDLVIGMGGFVSGPVIIAAYLLRIDTMIHEQNVIPGRSTTFLAKFAKKILFSYKESLQYLSKYNNKLYYTGNPVRNEFFEVDREEAREKIGIDEDEILIISMGGSSGAKMINDLSVDIADLVKENEKLKYIHITGKYYEQIYRMKNDINKFSDRVVVKPYVEDMPTLLSAADLMVARAGAITLAEMAAVGLPGLIIPSPNVTRDHQTFNARAVEKNGTCIVMIEKEFDKNEFKETVLNLTVNSDRLNTMRKSYKGVVKENALNTIISLIYDYNLR